MGEQCGEGWGPMSIRSELRHLEEPINFLSQEKKQMGQANFEPGISRPRVLRSALAAHWLSYTGAPHNWIKMDFLISAKTPH